MITLNKVGGQTSTKIAEFTCKQADITNLPINDIPNGSTAFVFDIPALYIYDADIKEWVVV